MKTRPNRTHVRHGEDVLQCGSFADAAECVQYDYFVGKGKPQLVHYVCGYRNDESVETYIPHGIMVRVVDTPKEDILHRVDNTFDPYWNIEIHQGDNVGRLVPVTLLGLTSLYTYGQSYQVKPAPPEPETSKQSTTETIYNVICSSIAGDNTPAAFADIVATETFATAIANYMDAHGKMNDVEALDYIIQVLKHAKGQFEEKWGIEVAPQPNAVAEEIAKLTAQYQKNRVEFAKKADRQVVFNGIDEYLIRVEFRRYQSEDREIAEKNFPGMPLRSALLCQFIMELQTAAYCEGNMAGFFEVCDASHVVV